MGVNIIIPKGRLALRCGKCGNMKYEILVLPKIFMAKVMAVRCTNCKNELKIMPDNFLEGTGIAGVPGKTIEKVEKCHG